MTGESIGASALNKHIGKRVRRRRKALGLTQHKLAERMGIRFQQVQKYEAGDNGVSAFRLWQLSRALDMPVESFFADLEIEMEMSQGLEGDGLLQLIEELSAKARRQLASFLASLKE